MPQPSSGASKERRVAPTLTRTLKLPLGHFRSLTLTLSVTLTLALTLPGAAFRARDPAPPRLSHGH